MVKASSGLSKASSPPINGYYWYCGGCGYRSEVFWERQPSYEELLNKEWEILNGKN
jgi:hypothetical protein